MKPCSQSAHKQGPGVISGNYATKHSRVDQHKYFFAQRVVKPWNSLNITSDDWSSVAQFKTLIKYTDLSDFLYLVEHPALVNVRSFIIIIVGLSRGVCECYTPWRLSVYFIVSILHCLSYCFVEYLINK